MWISPSVRWCSLVHCWRALSSAFSDVLALQELPFAMARRPLAQFFRSAGSS